MTTRAQIHAHLDGTGTLTIGDRTESVQAENLSAGLAELLALVVAEAARVERPVEVLADLEDNPPTGLRVHPDGEITEDSSILPSLFTSPATTDTPTDAPLGPGTADPEPSGAAVASPARRHSRRGRMGAWIGAGAVVTLLAAASIWAVVGDGQEPPARAATPSASTTPTATTTSPPTTPATTPPVAATWEATVSARPETARLRLEVANVDGPVKAKVLLRRAGAQKRVAFITVPRRGVARVQLKDVDPGQWRWTIHASGKDLPDLRGGVLVPPRAAPVRSPAPSPTPATIQASPEPTQAPTPTATQPTPQPQPPKPTRSGDGDRGGNGPGNGPVDPGSTDGPIDPND